MTMDKSLRIQAGLVRSRSVLTRGERIIKLQEGERWQEGRSPLGLPKVRVLKLALKKKKVKKEETAEGAVAAAGAAAPAAGAKGAKPAAGAKAPAAAKAAPAKPAAGAKAPGKK
jgi:small basic protein (TIGR04137 family)